MFKYIDYVQYLNMRKYLNMNISVDIVVGVIENMDCIRWKANTERDF